MLQHHDTDSSFILLGVFGYQGRSSCARAQTVSHLLHSAGQGCHGPVSQAGRGCVAHAVYALRCLVRKRLKAMLLSAGWGKFPPKKCLERSEAHCQYHAGFKTLYYTILYYTILYYTILYYTILYYTILYYALLYYTLLYSTIFYYTIHVHPSRITHLCELLRPWPVH